MHSSHRILLQFTLLAVVLSLAILSDGTIIRILPKRQTQAPEYKQPYVTFYVDEFHRGNYYHHFLRKECTNMPAQYAQSVSSVNVYERCVYLCDKRDCEGNCQRIHDSTNKGIDKLHSIGLNDNVFSVKYCYTFAERG